MLARAGARRKPAAAVPCSGPVSQDCLPAGFQFGVATSGFQVEGGFNGPGEPANNWQRWESEGRVEPSGIALDLWRRYEEALDRTRALGCDSFRLSVEWARCEPCEGDWDQGALDRYRQVLQACAERGLVPLVTLHHFTHPAWLGEDFWLDPSSPERFCEWVGRAVGHLSGWCSQWVTINEINVYAIQADLTGSYPPGRRADVRSALRALDHMACAHVHAYDLVHRLQPDATVTTNNASSSVYELDHLVVDVLSARAAGVARPELGTWLKDRRRLLYERLPQASPLESLLRATLARVVPLDQALARTAAAVYECQHPCPLDSLAIDYYDPVVAHHLRLPGHRSAGGRVWSPSRPLWDDVVDPAGLTTYLEAGRRPGLPLQVAEAGLCNRVRRGRSFPRSDGWSRPEYLRGTLGAVVAAVGAGIPVTGYWHWTLADNYEWGSYEPRFGIFGVDRERGGRWSRLDSMGQDSAGAYSRLIDSLRQGDTALLH
jgi:beta-glucosidase